MGFTVKQLLITEEMGYMTLLGGEKGLSNDIRGVTIIEAPDIVKFINGGELLLTGLYAFKSCTLDEFKNYVNELPGKQISGLIIKKGREVEQAEEKIRLLEQYSEIYNIPLIEVPFEISFQMIMSTVMERLFGEEVTQLKYFKMTHDNFTALSLSNSYRQNPVGDILDMLNKLIRNPVALYNQNLTCYASTEPDREDLNLSDGAEVYDPGIITNYQYLKQTGEETKYIVKINLNVGVKMYLAVTERNSEFGQMDCIAIENAIVALQYEFSRKYALSELEKKFQNDILNNLLNGKISSPEELRKNTALLGLDPDGDYRVFVLGTVSSDMISDDLTEHFRNTNCLEDAVRQQFPEAAVQKDVNRLVIVVPVTEERSQAEYREELSIKLERIQAAVTAQKKTFQVKAGAGKIGQWLLHLQETEKEAGEAYKFVEIMKEISQNKQENFVLFSDLGIFKLLSQIKDPDELLELIPESLQKLYNYQKPQRDELIITLKTYLDYNQNLSKTARDLFVHYKTASYRLERITAITGMDFDDPREMLSVRIGLIVYEMMEQTADF